MRYLAAVAIVAVAIGAWFFLFGLVLDLTRNTTFIEKQTKVYYDRIT